MTDVNIGKGLTIAVDFSTMPQPALDHLLYIGARNVLMDCHASVTADEYPDADERAAAAMAMAEKKLAALMAGEVRVSGSREGDPIKAEALRIASKIIVDALKAAGKIKKAADIDAKVLREKAGELVTKRPDIMETAKRIVAERKTATVDLGDIGL